MIKRIHGANWRGLRAIAAIGGMALIGVITTRPLSAQQAITPSTATPEQNLEEIVVTGTLIPQPGQASISPLSILSHEDLVLQGNINVEEMLNRMPQLRADNTASSNNPGTGIATLDLRGLGTNRNLVLVDGRRVTPSGQDGTVDVNNIPVEMIDRVDVVTGGASSTYGSDAMSGVVNFILKKDVTGFETRASYGLSTRGDARESYVATLFGAGVGDGGNIMVDLSYFKRDSVLESARGFASIDVASLSGYATNANGFPWQGGSSRGTPSLVSLPSDPNPRISTGITLSDGTNCDAIAGPSRTLGTLVPTATGVRGFCPVVAPFGGDRYNFNPVSDLVTPQTRWNIATTGHVPLESIPAEAYVEAFYVKNETAIQQAAAPLSVSNDVTISPTSPFLNAATQTALASRADPALPEYVTARLTAFGPRVDRFTSDFAQLSAGLRGHFGSNWHWNLYGAYGRVQVASVVADVARDRLQAEFNDCPAGSAAGCVPQSPFAAYSPAAISWAALSNVTDTTVFQRNTVALDTNGSLFELPAGPLRAAFGAEYRRDSSIYTPDSQKEAFGGQGNIIGFFAALPVSGAENVKEFYSELQVPLIEDQVFKSLELSLGGRASDYSTVGTIWTDKIGLKFEPGFHTGLGFRGVLQVATRAPALSELYAAPFQSNPGVFDPCDSRFFDGTATTRARCNGTVPVIGLNGAPITPVDPNTFRAVNTQVNAYSRGNSALAAETAHTLTFGVTWRPAQIAGLYSSIDYYRIRISNYISSEFGGAQPLVNACFQNSNTAACSLLSRDATGVIVIGDPGTNQGIQEQNNSTLKTSGEDLTLAYAFDLGNLVPGRFSLGANVNHLDSWLYTGIGGATLQCAGVLCAGATSFQSQPKWHGIFSATYRLSELTVQWRARYIGKLADTLGGGQDFLGIQRNGSIPVIPAFVYHDLSLSYDMGSRVTANLSISNLFNKQPPVLYDAGSQDNTDIYTYDVVGRYLRLSLSARF